MFLRKRQKGQSTVEYIVLVTAVIVIIIAFVVSPSGPFATRMNASLDAVTNAAQKKAADLVTAQATFAVSATTTNVIGNKASSGLCTGNKVFDPSTNNCI